MRLRRHRLESAQRRRDVAEAGYDSGNCREGVEPIRELTVRSNSAQPLFMHVDENRIGIATRRDLAQLKPDGIERIVDASVITGIFQATMGEGDNAAFAADIFRRARIARWILGGDPNGVADLKFALCLALQVSQSGRTRGISGSICAASRSRRCAGSSA